MTRRRQALKEHNKLVPKGRELQFYQKPNRCKPTPLRKLTADVVEELWQAVRVEFLTHEQAAARFGITTVLVQKLIGRMKKEPNYVNKLRK